MLLAQILWGLGVTFESGAIDAWVSDELGADRAGAAFLRAAQVGQVVSFVGIGLATALGSLYLGLPMIAGGLGFAATALFLVLLCQKEGSSGTYPQAITLSRQCGRRFGRGSSWQTANLSS